MRDLRPIAVVLLASASCIDARAPVVEGPCVEAEGHVCSRLHDPQILNPDSPEFHGVLLRSIAYDLDTCYRCHGGAGGGGSGTPCSKCHEDGVDECANCHSKIADQGAHRVHLEGGALGMRFDCDACHRKPKGLYDANHVRLYDGSLDPPPVEVPFGPLARKNGAVPSFDPVSKTCKNVYCHGGALPETRGGELMPRWEPGQDLGCARCHGMPPADHGSDRCQDCHPRVAGPQGLVDASLHFDGAIDLGQDGLGSCQSCHQQQDHGHQVHLTAPRGLRGPLVCADCHLTPAQTVAPGHLDSPPPAEVFPEGFGGLGAARGAMPSYQDRSCTNTYCHGPGTLSFDGGDESVYCGSCHGVPPAGPAHIASWTIETCSMCHAASVDAHGQILVGPEGSAHLNGVVER